MGQRYRIMEDQKPLPSLALNQEFSGGRGLNPNLKYEKIQIVFLSTLMFYSIYALIFLVLLRNSLVVEFNFINLCRFFIHLSSQGTSKTIKHLFTGTLRQSKRAVLIRLGQIWQGS